jgi:hypothetical protein
VIDISSLCRALINFGKKYNNIFCLAGIAIYFISRIPLIIGGFGEPDAWLKAASIRELAITGNYHPSRLPGFPFVAHINAALYKISNVLLPPNFDFWLISNFATAIVSLIGIYAYAEILKYYKVKNSFLIIFTFVFLPIFWIASTSTIDYMWALSFMLLSYLLALRGYIIISGSILGIACGCRLTSCLILPALLLLVYVQVNRNLPSGDIMKKVRSMILLALSCIVITVICYLPCFLTPEYLSLNIKKSVIFLYASLYESAWKFWAYKFIYDIFGLPGFLVFVILLLICIVQIFKSKQAFKIMDLNLFLIVLFYVILFIFKPEKNDYLIPAIPFLLILVDKLVPKKIFVIFLVLIISNSMVSFFTLDIAKYRNEKKISFHIIDKGLILKDIDFRNEYLAAASRLTQTKFPQNSIIIVGWYSSILKYLSKDWNQSDPKYVSVLKETEIKNLLKDHSIYYIPPGYRTTLYNYGYDLKNSGAQLLPIGS